MTYVYVLICDLTYLYFRRGLKTTENNLCTGFYIFACEGVHCYKRNSPFVLKHMHVSEQIIKKWRYTLNTVGTFPMMIRNKESREATCGGGNGGGGRGGRTD